MSGSRQRPDFDQTRLAEMLREVECAPELHRPSPHWQDLGGEHLRRLEAWGFENFKRTISIRYFGWRLHGLFAHQYWPVAKYWLSHRDWSVFGGATSDYRSPRGRGIHSMGTVHGWLYQVYVAMLANFVWEQDPWKLMQVLEEPALGNPFTVRFRDRWVSQDLCNSIHEFYSAWDCEGWGKRPAVVAEIGAGYGRLADVFLRALPGVSVCVVDLPPALFLAQEYLGRLFPNDQIFRFRPFQSYSEVKDEFESARIRFLMAHQLALLPAKTFDLVINISSLHEMTRPQIEHYYREIDRVCRGRFYTKQYLRSRERENRHIIRHDEYPVPATWTRLRHRRHPIQSWFYDELYDVGPTGQKR